ncbi:MAG: septal ring lytic transglycosylase RlpA family lipoprotein [Pseudopedobacter saltans]|uniref:Probable endolytic peptidoglycan transglycosylase RlpA n=1 Tax=Pseudopedobacter saltans TaxID=151895 RepID=A0A2W5FG27_9SPHI|nr:MAG: septal ring lytic transglycosylase RlpA family lipoprotein [Pseudopedobacter saltans]
MNIRKINFALFLIGLTTFVSCSKSIVQSGKASYYAGNFIGKKTANGETFAKYKKTAASKTLPFGTKVKVTNMTNGKSVKVRINDRGPFVAGRDIDLSWLAAKKIGMLDQGVAPVQLKYKLPKK